MPSHRHMVSLRCILNRSHHSLAPLHHPLVPFHRPIMQLSNLGLMPLHHPELCITVTLLMHSSSLMYIQSALTYLCYK